jgi:hypothetical protein
MAQRFRPVAAGRIIFFAASTTAPRLTTAHDSYMKRGIVRSLSALQHISGMLIRRRFARSDGERAFHTLT